MKENTFWDSLARRANNDRTKDSIIPVENGFKNRKMRKTKSERYSDAWFGLFMMIITFMSVIVLFIITEDAIRHVKSYIGFLEIVWSPVFIVLIYFFIVGAVILIKNCFNKKGDWYFTFFRSDKFIRGKEICIEIERKCVVEKKDERVREIRSRLVCEELKGVYTEEGYVYKFEEIWGHTFKLQTSLGLELLARYQFIIPEDVPKSNDAKKPVVWGWEVKILVDGYLEDEEYFEVEMC